MKNFFILLIFLTTTHLAAQNKIYQAEREKVHNLIHTKLKVDFNFEKSCSQAPSLFHYLLCVVDCKATQAYFPEYGFSLSLKSILGLISSYSRFNWSEKPF